MEIIENSFGIYLVQFMREGEEFLFEIEFKIVVDIDWVKIIQYVSIVIEVVMFVM